MGCHRKPSRIRFPHRLPSAAAPALASVAAAICLSPQALADTPAAQAVTHHAVAADAAYWPATPPAQLMATAWWAKQAEPAAAERAAAEPGAAERAAAEPGTAEPSSPATYTVRANDSLSSIAGRVYHNPNAWPVLYWANRSKIHWANVIETGQVLRVPVKPAKIPAAPALLGPSAPPAPAAAAPAGPEAMPAAPVPATGMYSGGAFGQCVIARESGGQSQVMNGSGHYGLYQFSAGTWAAYGGSPADFGHASVGEQNQVFDNALAAGGQSNWSAYDGC